MEVAEVKIDVDAGKHDVRGTKSMRAVLTVALPAVLRIPLLAVVTALTITVPVLPWKPRTVQLSGSQSCSLYVRLIYSMVSSVTAERQKISAKTDKRVRKGTRWPSVSILAVVV